MVTRRQLISNMVPKPPRHQAILCFMEDVPAIIKATQKNMIPNPIQGTSIDKDLPPITKMSLPSTRDETPNPCKKILAVCRMKEVIV